MSDEYHQLLKRIVKGAHYLDNPLISPSERRRWEKLYDQLCQQAIQMREGMK
jgi:hypothetical protein